MVSTATTVTPPSGAASGFSHQAMSLGVSSAAGCLVRTRWDRDGSGGNGRMGVGMGWGGMGREVAGKEEERRRRAILS